MFLRPLWSAWTRPTSVRYLQRPRKSHSSYEKHIKKKKKSQEVKKKSVTLWTAMNPKELGKALDIPHESLFDIVSHHPASDCLLEEDRSIDNPEIFAELGKTLHFKAKFVSNPGKNSKESEEYEDIYPEPDNLDACIPRSPVVAILGHIDHGKTTLLDYLRKSSVTESEFGGITQHISAFSVPVTGSFERNRITFIDTPGHAAFKSMRNRGVSATDIAILVVDSCEGVLEQTIESLRMIRDSNTPFIVAINKIDKPTSDIKHTKDSLREATVDLEEFGGEIQSVPISAKLGTNIPDLLNAIAALAEVLQLKGDPTGQVQAGVLESYVEFGKGKSAVLLINKGSLKKGDLLVADTHYVKVRALMDENGKELLCAGPSDVVRVSGWRSLPSAGDQALQSSNEKRAADIANLRKRNKMLEKALIETADIEKRRALEREAYVEHRISTLKSGRMKSRKNYLNKFYSSNDEIPKLSFVIKADVNGSLEAILDCISSYNGNDQVKLDIIDVGVGDVTQNDVISACEFDGIVYAFNVSVNKIDASSKEPRDNVRSHNVIYKLMDDLKSEINLRMPIREIENVEGIASLQKEFLITVNKKKFPVAGVRVIQGKFLRNSLIRIKRDNKVIAEGLKLINLKHLKNEVSETTQGMECGLIVDDPSFRFKESDEITCYRISNEKGQTEWKGGY